MLYAAPSPLQLDYKVDDKMLRDVFKIAGKVVNVEISKDQDGKSRGFGVVGELTNHIFYFVLIFCFIYLELMKYHIHFCVFVLFYLFIFSVPCDVGKGIQPQTTILKTSDLIITS